MKTPEDEAFEEIERIQRTRTRWVPLKKPQEHMTQDEIFAMAKEAGFMQHLGVICIPNIQNLEAFAKLVAEKEREACVKVCEDLIERVKPLYAVTAENCVKAIRARGQA
jgi:hypothetical protein